MSTLDTLRLFIENAPEARNIIGPLVGVKGDDFVICHQCLDRILRRGCTMPNPYELIWDDKALMTFIDCDLKEFH